TAPAAIHCLARVGGRTDRDDEAGPRGPRRLRAGPPPGPFARRRAGARRRVSPGAGVARDLAAARLGARAPPAWGEGYRAADGMDAPGPAVRARARGLHRADRGRVARGGPGDGRR